MFISYLHPSTIQSYQKGPLFFKVEVICRIFLHYIVSCLPDFSPSHCELLAGFFEIGLRIFLTLQDHGPSWCGPKSAGILQIGPVWPEKSSNGVPCKCNTLCTALLQLSWETRFKNLIQEKQKSWACNFWASCNSWVVSPLSLSIFWATQTQGELFFFFPKRCLGLAD